MVIKLGDLAKVHEKLKQTPDYKPPYMEKMRDEIIKIKEFKMLEKLKDGLKQAEKAMRERLLKQHERCLGDDIGGELAGLTEQISDSSLKTQIGGDHYKNFAIQPIVYAFKNNLNFLQGNIVKYTTRYKIKNGREDLEKAKHYIDMLIEFEYGGENDN